MFPSNDAELLDGLAELVANLNAAEVINLEVRDARRDAIDTLGYLIHAKLSIPFVVLSV